MNLQVAWSLSKGEGYRRTYGDRPPFPPEVQTNVPLTVPAALVFRLFGVGAVQAQLVNVVYLFGLAAVCFVLLFRRFGWLPAGVCTLLLAATPGIVLNGMNGYGEIIGLFWFFAALLVYPWKAGRRRLPRILLAGVCLGLALCAKIVMAICVAGFVLVVVLLATMEGKRNLGREAIGIAILLIGTLIPVVATEIWRAVSLGGLPQAQAWWWQQITAVGRQAGVLEEYRDTPNLWAKVRLHLANLSRFYGLPVPLLLVWILSPFALLAVTIRTNFRRAQGVLLCVLMAAAIYFVWWLAITPTQKAWHRRILNGTLMLNFAWVYLAAHLSHFGIRNQESWLGRAAQVLMLLCVGLAIFFFSAIVGPELAEMPTPQPDVQQAIRMLSELPPNAEICGIGWYSAPTFSLFSKRPFGDFNDLIVERIDRSKPVYVVLDLPAIAARKGDLITSTYQSRPLLPQAQRVQILEVNLNSLNDELTKTEAASARSILSLDSNPGSLIGGFYGVRSSGGRWMTSDAFVRLLYDGSRNLAMTVEAASMARYMHKGSVTLTFSIDGNPIGSFRINQSGSRVIELPIPEKSRPGIGEVSAVRISSDNLIKSGIMVDDRSMSVIARGVGFVTAASDLERTDGVGTEQVPELRLLHQTAETLPTSDTVLRIKPNPVDFCTDQHRRVELVWDMARAKPGIIEIWLKEPNGRRKLWIETRAQRGTEVTGEWVVEGMKFIALDVTNQRVLNVVEVEAADCR